MRDRRESVRDKVMYGGVAEIGERGATRECIVRNISDHGATIEFSNDVQLPKEQLSLRIARKGRSFLAKVIWWRDNFVGVAFRAESPAEPVSDLAERLRRSEIKKRQLAAPHRRTARRALKPFGDLLGGELCRRRRRPCDGAITALRLGLIQGLIGCMQQELRIPACSRSRPQNRHWPLR